MSKTPATEIALTPEVLRTLAEGISRLRDGDLDDRDVADRVETMVALVARLTLGGTFQWVPFEEATSGYVAAGDGAPLYAYITYEGHWTTHKRRIPDGVQVFRDETLTEPMRKTRRANRPSE